MENIRDTTRQERIAHVMATAVGVGCICGLLLGVIIGNLPFGVAAGLGIAMVFGVVFSVIRTRRSKARSAADA